MTTHIMLDLETWGKRPGCDIRSIGACVFDPVTGYVAGHDCPVGSRKCPTFYIACENPVWEGADPMYHGEHFDETTQVWRKYPLHRNPDTVKWWSEQPEEAQSAFIDPVDLREALVRFTDWFTMLDEQDAADAGPTGGMLRIYAHGPQFDISILEAAYGAVGLPVPWHYREPRDTRTVFDLAGIDNHSAWLKQFPGPLGVSHHALDDSICQARAVCAAWQRIIS